MINVNKGTTRVILIMTLVVLIGLGTAWRYYEGVNKSEDPRVVEAKRLYENYNQYIRNNKFENVLNVLDSIENIYTEIEHYRKSYEVGVVNTDRAAYYLTVALFKDSTFFVAQNNIAEVDYSKDSLLNIAQYCLLKSIDVYKNWMIEFGVLSENEIREKIGNDFFIEKRELFEENDDIYLKKRVNNILLAQTETPRRLSVCYTNLGIIKRHQDNYNEAAILYKKAIDLWERNYTAKNNLNLILGRPIEKPSIIERLFPPEKDD